MTDKQQHVDMHRKVALRRQLLDTLAVTHGPAYVPFIGDGDIAAQVYASFDVYGADLDPARVASAAARFPDAVIVEADCDGWPFPDYTDAPFVVGDFDAYSEPYAGFRAFFEQAPLADRVALFFTDGHRWGAAHAGVFHHPDGRKIRLESTTERRQVFNGYLTRHIYPWFSEYVAREDYKVERTMGYLKAGMTYWGSIIQA